MVKRLVLAAVEIYQRTLSPDHGFFRAVFPQGVCRFHPTCSEYLYWAVERYGALAGFKFGFYRVSRCHPFHSGGYDPLPND